MPIKIYFAVSGLLVGIGLTALLTRKNLVSIVLALLISGVGVVLAAATIDSYTKTSQEGSVFAICFGVVLFVFSYLGAVVAYRRHMNSGATRIDEEVELKH